MTSRYLDGRYADATGGSWHREDSPFKAHQVLSVLRRLDITPATVCEIGCGAGGVLAALQSELDPQVQLVGFDISPQAIEMAGNLANDRLTFRCEDPLGDSDRYDLVLLLDVVEHIEDCFGFLRRARLKGDIKIIHLPLAISLATVFRQQRIVDAWRKVGHIHQFSLATALEAVRYSGLEILDWQLTPGALEAPQRSLRTRLANLPRKIVGAFGARYAQQLLGGY
jgi:SAM-dependent methyltransferase